MLDFNRELQGQEYRAFLVSSMARCKMGLLVVQFPLGPSGQSFLDRLTPFVTEITEQSEWPGTSIIGSARVYYFTLSEESVDLLASTSSSMFGWTGELPEDLALLRIDGSPWFESVVHEEWACLILNTDELAELYRSRPSWSLSLDQPRRIPE